MKVTGMVYGGKLRAKEIIEEVEMKLKVLFDAIGVIALLLLVFQVILQAIRIRENRVLSKWRIWVNWVLILLLIVGFGGGSLSKSRTIQISQGSSSSSQKSSSSLTSSTVSSSHKVVKQPAATDAGVRFKPAVELGKDNTIRVAFTIPPKTQMQLARDDNKQVLATVNNPTNGEMQFSYLFGQDGTFDVLGMNGKNQVEKKLTVNKQGDAVANDPKANKSYTVNYHQPLKWVGANSKQAANATSATQSSNATNK